MRTRSEWFLTPVGERLVGTDSDPTAIHVLRGSNRSSSGNIGKFPRLFESFSSFFSIFRKTFNFVNWNFSFESSHRLERQRGIGKAAESAENLVQGEAASASQFVSTQQRERREGRRSLGSGGGCIAFSGGDQDHEDRASDGNDGSAAATAATSGREDARQQLQRDHRGAGGTCAVAHRWRQRYRASGLHRDGRKNISRYSDIQAADIDDFLFLFFF